MLLESVPRGPAPQAAPKAPTTARHPDVAPAPAARPVAPETRTLAHTAAAARPVEAGRALHALDARNGSRAATDQQVRDAAAPTPAPTQSFLNGVAGFFGDATGTAGHATQDLGTVASGVVDGVRGAVATARHVGAAVLDTAGALGRTAAQDGARLADGAARYRGEPGKFADWLAGPDAPAVQDFTADVPGLQKGIGDVIDGAMKNPAVSNAVGKVLGFQYVPNGDFYTTNEDSIQSHLGFHDAYDVGGKVVGGMDLDRKVISFKAADGTDTRVELWKGNYGAGGGFGGEIGLYTKGGHDRGLAGDVLEKIPGYFSSASGNHQVHMTQTIYDKNSPDKTPYFTNDNQGSKDGAHYWNLAIRTDPGVRAQDLGQRGTLTMNSAADAATLRDEMNKQGLNAWVGGETGEEVSYTWE